MSALRGVGVGAGYFSHYQYEAWSRIPEVSITALCNLDEEQGREVAQRYGIPSAYGWNDFEVMLERERPDFVDIVTPPETHLELVRKAASRGIAVICQKPLAPTWEESLRLVESAGEAGIRLLVHENWRWQPWYREMKRQMEGGAIGELFSVAVRMRMGDGWGAEAYLSRQPFFRSYPRLLVYETCVHFLDTFRFLGGEIDAIYARLQRRNAAIAGEDAGQIVATFRSGATGLLDASRYNEVECADPRYTFGSVRLDGSRGHIELDLEGGLTLKPLGEPTRVIDYGHERRGFAGDSVYALQRHFTDSMLDGAPFESTGEDYLRTVALVEACYRSAAEGEVAYPAEPSLSGGSSR
jgi:predicted dehydrogenase